MHVLITGGAGFIGSHAADELLSRGHKVRLLDALHPQVHEGGVQPDYLAADAELVVADLRDRQALARAMQGIDAVLHLAAMVGVGQSMYRIADYVSVNDLGTAHLLEEAVQRGISRLVVASSMSVYGEGLLRRSDGSHVEQAERSPEQLRRGQWELLDGDDTPLQPVPTPESKRPVLTSVYAINKHVQERLCLATARAYDIPAVALRFFNVYGSRQALSNPYTGVLAIFAARLLNGKPPLLFEDGAQRRDFVHVRDVARACRLALEQPGLDDEVFNVGSGRSVSIAEVAELLARSMNLKEIRPEIVGRYRAGDIRHCFADVAHARDKLGFSAAVTLEEGLTQLVGWLAGETAVDRVEEATQELRQRGLVA